MTVGTKLEKAYLQLLKPGPGGGNLARVNFQFNPKEYTIQKGASWESKPAKGSKTATMPEYKGPEPQSMTIEVFLDATGSTDAPSAGLDKDVKTLFSCCIPLPETLKSKKPSPPWVLFGWGNTVLFRAYVKQVSVKYTLFKPNGTPIRAAASVTLQEIPSDPAGQNPTSGTLTVHRTHTVLAGDTLASIAYAEYGSAALWRAVAEANRLDDPMRLRTGSTLLIPPPEDAVAYA